MQRNQAFLFSKIYFNSLLNQSSSLSRCNLTNVTRRCGPRPTSRPVIFNTNKYRFLSSLAAKKDFTDLKISSWPHSLSLNHVWLRDHCRCKECYNFTTNQRKLDLLSIPSDIHPEEFYIEDKHLVVLWPDRHLSKYPLNWLWDRSYAVHVQKSQHQPILWDKNSASSVAHVDMADYMNREESLKTLVESVVNYGVGIVENVPATMDATEEVVVRMAAVQTTLFGGMWEFSDELAHSDTAYTREALGAHTDNTYFNEAAGLQIFHCFHHDGEGGENLLVDGFRVARDLRENHLESYNLLTSTPIEAEYLEPGQHYSYTAPVLRLNPLTTFLEQVRFNLYDRAPMSLPTKEIPKFYEALRLFATEIRRPEGEWWIKLRPGRVIFIDNWRVLHGRSAYTGSRKMGGCYVNRSDFLSKARVLGIL